MATHILYAIFSHKRDQTPIFSVLVHRIIPCNKWLYDITICESSLCSFCKEEDSLTHFFIHCKTTKSLWISFFHWWYRTSGIDIQNTLDEHILFGYPGNNDVEDVLNYCILFGKYYIYCKKLYGSNNIDFYDYLVRLKERLTFEKHICQTQSEAFEKWVFIYEQL